MKPKTLILLAVAVGCGLVAMLGIQQAMQGGQGGGVPKVNVLVAKADIAPGVELTDELVGFTDMAKEAVPEDAVTAPDQYAERALNYGAVTGDIIRQSKLGKPGEFTQSRQIPPGMRVVSISVNDTQTVGGMMRPGDRVDLSVTFQIRNARGLMTTRTKTLLEYVEVFATDNRTVSDGVAKQETKTKVVSLVVTPEQVNYVKLAENKGQLALSWRNPNDSEAVSVSDIDSDLLVELEGVIPEQELERSSPRGPALYADDVAKEPGADAASPGGFLTEAEGEQAPAPAPEPAPPERPKWTVRIYQGNEPLQAEFELPADAEPAAESPGADGTSDGNSTQASLTDAFRWLHQTFTQGQLSSTKL